MWGCRTKVRGITLAFPTLLTTWRPVSLRGPIRTDHLMDTLVGPLAPKVRACLSACSHLSCTFLVIWIARMYTYHSFLIHFYAKSFYRSVFVLACVKYSHWLCVWERSSRSVWSVWFCPVSACWFTSYCFFPYICLFCTLTKNICVLHLWVLTVLYSLSCVVVFFFPGTFRSISCIGTRNWSETCGSRDSGCVGYCLLEYYTVQSGRSLPTFWNKLLFHLPYTSTLKPERQDSCRMLVMVCQATQCCISEDTIFTSNKSSQFCFCRLHFSSQAYSVAMKGN